MKVLVPLAEGFEEIEAVTIIDVLRRADIEVTVACLEGDIVCGSHRINIKPDISLDDCRNQEFDMIVLPGGMPGSDNLEKSEILKSILISACTDRKWIGAICAAPKVLGAYGMLSGKQATCYPGFESKLKGAEIQGKRIVMDDTFITARGAGVAMEFALEIVKILKGGEIYRELRENMLVE
ncbi:MAG: DJ-1 family glyoxalase III [Thermodesulfobacteriota bacterium]|nr:DJ-1 family glyoxalase III [Thermodesulfobacteriota bacterium]